MRTSPFTCRPAMITDRSSNVRAVCRASSTDSMAVVTHSRFYGHCASYVADRDQDTDQDAQAATFFNGLGMTTPFISGSQPDSQ